MGIYVNYGCGLSCPEGWLNFDVSPRLRLEKIPGVGAVLRMSGKALFPKGVRYGDIVSGLPLLPASASGVYCSHVLEHLDRQSVEIALRNTFALLQPGGTFRLIVPDLLWRARELVASADAGVADAADRFLRKSYLGREQPRRGGVGRLRAMIGNSEHLWMYDFGQMATLLVNAGFVDVRRCQMGDAADPMFQDVEVQGRFFDDGHAELAIEARRPTVR